MWRSSVFYLFDIRVQIHTHTGMYMSLPEPCMPTNSCVHTFFSLSYFDNVFVYMEFEYRVMLCLVFRSEKKKKSFSFCLLFLHTFKIGMHVYSVSLGIFLWFVFFCFIGVDSFVSCVCFFFIIVFDCSMHFCMVPLVLVLDCDWIFILFIAFYIFKCMIEKRRRSMHGHYVPCECSYFNENRNFFFFFPLRFGIFSMKKEKIIKRAWGRHGIDFVWKLGKIPIK